MAFRTVQVCVQREPKNEVQKGNNQGSRGEDDAKSPLGRVARTIPVLHARQAACPLPVVDDGKFAARAPPLRSCRSCRGAFSRTQGRAEYAMLSWQQEAGMRRCGKQCYVVEIYWTGLLRASETLSIANLKVPAGRT